MQLCPSSSSVTDLPRRCPCLLAPDVDVLGDPGHSLRQRTIDPSAPIERKGGQDLESGGVPRQRLDSSNVQASGLQVQKRPIHLRQLCRCFPLPMVITHT